MLLYHSHTLTLLIQVICGVQEQSAYSTKTMLTFSEGRDCRFPLRCCSSEFAAVVWTQDMKQRAA